MHFSSCQGHGWLLAFICKLAQENGERKMILMLKRAFIFFVVVLCGWMVGWHNLIILWGDRAIYPEKGLLDPTYQEKGFFILNLEHNWRIISYHLQFPLGRLLVCTEGQACYWPDIDLCLVEKEKAKKASDFHFLLRFVWIHQLGLGVTWDWNQRKNFHFHIPNRFHIKPLLYKTLPTYNFNAPAIFTCNASEEF